MNTTTTGTAANGVTVLTAKSMKTGKTYSIGDDGDLNEEAYGNEWEYFCEVVWVTGIHQLAKLVLLLSTNQITIIIRDQPKVITDKAVPRTKEIYQEPPEGLSWAMLDFDKITLPDGLSPASREAIEWLIEQLPEPFHNASYFYQFSSSTGIFRSDGTPRKRGLNVHLFFWFSQPVTGQLLKAYLTDHCIKTEFLYPGHNKVGHPRITYGVDMALFNPVQPHYIAAPIIKEGVKHTLDEKDRQGLVEKLVHSVVLPEMHKDLPALAKAAHDRVLAEWKIACGFVKTPSVTKSSDGGIAVHHYYRNPNPAAVTTGRRMAKEPKLTDKLDPNGQPVTYATLYFEGEGTPGSWSVSTRSPVIARHFDSTRESLKELSEDAYCYVRDVLKWFSDVETNTLPLTPEGYLPPFNTFATAKNCIILAPTGTGKTKGFCDLAIAHRNEIIIYAAQTISLTQQMKHDLRSNGINVVHYSEDFNRFDRVLPGVHVTTNESMEKIVEWLRLHGCNFILVIDEVHMAIDDFMATNGKNELLENSIARAKRSFFMSGTISPLQKKKLVDTISIASGELTAENYGYYEFAPVKSNPLWWADGKQFGGDFVALLRCYQALKEAGESIPRTVIMVPTGKMRRYEILLDSHGLHADADVVSSPEASPNEIEAARVSHKAILVSSPVFALGQNFVCVPLRLWAFYDEYLQVDTSQIIQTLNRANRTAAACEVRLYSAILDPVPIRLPNELAMQLRVEEYFIAESEFKGLLDSHFQVERVTYLQLREHEKNTGKALYELKTNDSIQNFHIVEDWVNPFPATEEDQKTYNHAKTAANRTYAEDIYLQANGYQADPPALQLHFLNEVRSTRRRIPDPNAKKKEANDKKTALAMVLTKTDKVSIGKKVKPMRLLRLYGEAMTYLSGKHNWKADSEWMKAASKKTEGLAKLLSLVQRLQRGELDGVSFAKKMRLKDYKRSVTDAAENEPDHMKWGERFKVMDGLHAKLANKPSINVKAAIDGELFKFAKLFLATIGVTFELTKGTDGKRRIDPTKPVVPDLEYEEMIRVLLVMAKSLKDFPVEPLNELPEAHRYGVMSLAVCKRCVHCDPHEFCRLKRLVECELLHFAADTDQCDAFVQVPEELMRRQ